MEVKPYGTVVEFTGVSNDPPSAYIRQKMVEMLKKPLMVPLFISGVKAENLWWLQKRMRRGSWVAKCVEWDGLYRAQKRAQKRGKEKTLRVRRMKPIKLPEGSDDTRSESI